MGKDNVMELGVQKALQTLNEGKGGPFGEIGRASCRERV